jgi:hypothetical protein
MTPSPLQSGQVLVFTLCLPVDILASPNPPTQRNAPGAISRGRAGVAKSIRSVYADYGTQRQEIAIPPQYGRIKAGRATTVQKQSVVASKLIPEKTRKLAKRNF